MSSESVIDAASSYLRSNKHELVKRWIEWVRARSCTPKQSLLPFKAMENHVPPVLEALAAYISNPIDGATSQLVGELRLHGQIRRDQGYTAMDIVSEFEALTTLITNAVRTHLDTRLSDADPVEVAQLFMRLAAGLRAISHTALHCFTESDTLKVASVSNRLEEFANAISHEMRNPLSVLKLGLELMQKRGEQDGELAEDLSSMQVEVERALALLSTIKMLALTQGASVGARLVGVREAVNRSIDEIAGLANDQLVSVRVDGEIPDVKAETIVVYLVMANLLTNAVKYADHRKDDCSVVVSVSLVEHEHDTGFVEIRVTDNGLGISEEMVSRVTQRGFRAHPSHSYGTGMGLYIVQETINERGGEFEIESVENEGTTVIARLRSLSPDTEDLLDDRFDSFEFLNASIAGEFREAKPAAEYAAETGGKREATRSHS